MLNRLSIPIENNGFTDIHPTLPKMASVFINELLLQQSNCSPDIPAWLTYDKKSKPSRVPLNYKDISNDTQSGGEFEPSTSSIPSVSFALKNPVKKQNTVRKIVKGISHNFNNLLMGIWGNLSLIRLAIDRHANVALQLDEMEALIQDGAYLTHLILGYLGERRIFAQKIRLKQLTKEIKVLLRRKKSLGHLMERLEWNTLYLQPDLVAGSASIIFEQFLRGINVICKKLAKESFKNKVIDKRLACMQDLLNRGYRLTHRMRCSTNNIKLSKSSFNSRNLFHRLLKEVSEKYPEIIITYHEGRHLPRLFADKKLLKLALNEIIDNADRSMVKGGGKLELNINMLGEECTDERIGMHCMGNCLVITIKDNGKGIPIEVQPRIFEPFYSYPGNTTSVGLGLSVARGIIRAHCGKIQIQSTESLGSIFKIYIPL